jgi:hypothetical protein
MHEKIRAIFETWGDIPASWLDLSWPEISERCHGLASRLARQELTPEDLDLIGLSENVHALPGAAEARIAALLNQANSGWQMELLERQREELAGFVDVLEERKKELAALREKLTSQNDPSGGNDEEKR